MEINRTYKIFFSLQLLLLWGCEPFYDPVKYEDIPASPAAVWNKKPFAVKETAVNPFTAEDLSEAMSLSFLLDMALYNNPLTRVSWNNARAAAYAYRAALSPYYPTMDYVGALNAQTFKGSNFATSGDGIITTTTTSPTGPPPPSYITDLSNYLTVSYLVLDFGGRSASAEFARQALYSSNWQHDYTMQQVMLSVLTAYTSYIGNKGLVAAYEQNLKDAQVALKATQVMQSAGLSTLTDVLLTQSNLEQTRASLFQAQGSEKTSLAEILIAVGLPADSNISVENLPQKLPLIEISGDVSSLLELAKEKRPDLGVAIAAIKQQEAQLALSYSNGMPMLTANASWDQIRFISPRKPSGYNEVAFLELSFPIFQGFYFLNQQRQLRAQVEAALANLDVQLAAIATQVVTNYYAFTAAEAALPASEAALEYSKRAFGGYVVQYKTGTSSVLDMLTALTALSNARAQEVVTRTQWASSLANLAFSVGVLEDSGGMWIKDPPKRLYQLPINDDGQKEK